MSRGIRHGLRKKFASGAEAALIKLVCGMGKETRDRLTSNEFTGTPVSGLGSFAPGSKSHFGRGTESAGSPDVISWKSNGNAGADVGEKDAGIFVA
jgi:hypothetical protein